MPSHRSKNSLGTLSSLIIAGQSYDFFSLKKAESGLGDLSHLPCCVRILLENLLRHEDDVNVTIEDMRALSAFHALRKEPPPLFFRPSRLMISDDDAVSALTDLARMREILKEEKDDPFLLNPTQNTDIVIERCTDMSEENKERFSFLKWGKEAFKNMRIIPPGKGTSEALSLSGLSSVVRAEKMPGDEKPLLSPDTLVGSSYHLPLAGALGILAFSSDALDFESYLLDSYTPLAFSGILGIKLEGRPGAKGSATDIALQILRAMRQTKTSERIVEFYGPGLDHLSVMDRAVIADIITEASLLSVVFPIDAMTLHYLRQTQEDPSQIEIVEAYAKEQGLWRESEKTSEQTDPSFTNSLTFDLNSVDRSLGGPGLAHNALALNETAEAFKTSFPLQKQEDPLAPVHHGDVVLASLGPFGGSLHPTELLTAGLLARRARERGLKIKPWVHARLHLSSPILKDLLEKTNLRQDFEAIGFMLLEEEGSQDPLSSRLQEEIAKNAPTVCALATGSARPHTPFHPLCKANYIAAPAVIVAYALAGNMQKDLTQVPLTETGASQKLMLRELWPSLTETRALLESLEIKPLFIEHKKTLFTGSAAWENIETKVGPLFAWRSGSPILKKPELVKEFTLGPAQTPDITEAVPLAIFGDEISTDDFMPEGPIRIQTRTGNFLKEKGLSEEYLGVFESKTGNESVMLSGAFGNKDLRNLLDPAGAAGHTLHLPSGVSMPLSRTAHRYQEEGVPYLLFAGKNFGFGTRQEWAAKIMRLLNIPVIVAENFAPHFRLNLLRVGVLPLEIKQGLTLSDLELGKDVSINVAGITEFTHPPAEVMMTITHPETIERFMLKCAIHTEEEMLLWRAGSLWEQSLRDLVLLAS